MDIEGIDPDEARRLLRAADAGDAELARELELLGLAEQRESLPGARLIRLIMAAGSARDAEPLPADDWRRLIYETRAFDELVERRGLSPEAAWLVLSSVYIAIAYAIVAGRAEISLERLPPVERVAEWFAEAWRAAGAGDLEPYLAAVLAEEALHNVAVQLGVQSMDEADDG